MSMNNEQQIIDVHSIEFEINAKTFRNSLFKTRDYEATNVVACKALTPPGPQWVEDRNAIKGSMDRLYVQAGRIYFGWM